MANLEESSRLFDNLLFPKIFQTFRMAIHPSKLIIAFSALTIICLAGWIMDFTRTVVTTADSDSRVTELQIYLNSPDRLDSYLEINKEDGERTGVFSTLWHFAAVKFQGAVDSLLALNFPQAIANVTEYFRAVGWALRYHLVYSIIFFIIKLVVVSIAGGAICRISALQFAQGEKPGFTEAIQYSTKKFVNFLTAPLAPIGISVFLGLCIFLLGLLGNIPRAGELIIAICMLLALIAGILITIVLIGTIAGFNLMFPAIAYDGSDCFDAISRSFSYVYSKPWRMGFYTAIAALYGAICYMFVRAFAFLLLLVTHWSLELGIFVNNKEGINKLAVIWPRPQFMNLFGSPVFAAANWTESLAAFIIYIFILIVIGLVVAFIMSFYFSANTIIYSLMRNKVDNTALDEIYTYPEQTETLQGKEQAESTHPENDDS